MAEIPVLTCPVCDRSAGVRRQTPVDPEALKEAAWDHLGDHRDLDESKRAIYAVMMVDRREQVTLEVDELDGRTGEWVDGVSHLTA